MSKKSKKLSGAETSRRALDRPIDAQVLKQAREVVAHYGVIIQPDPDLGYLGRGLEFPYAMDDGRTPDECVTNTRKAMVAAVATMLEKGEAPPAPASERMRTEQINIRVTPEEKLLLEESARTKGFRGISDFVRSTSLSNAR